MRLSSSNAYLFLKEADEKSLLKFMVCFTRKLPVSWYEEMQCHSGSLAKYPVACSEFAGQVRCFPWRCLMR